MTINPYQVHRLAAYEVWILQGVEHITENNDNVDVEVRLPNGERYSATFFTLQNIATLMSRWTSTGECASGLYFVAEHPIVVRQLAADTILAVIADLHRNGQLAKWCERLEDTTANKTLKPESNGPEIED